LPVPTRAEQNTSPLPRFEVVRERVQVLPQRLDHRRLPGVDRSSSARSWRGPGDSAFRAGSRAFQRSRRAIARALFAPIRPQSPDRAAQSATGTPCGSSVDGGVVSCSRRIGCALTLLDSLGSNRFLGSRWRMLFSIAAMARFDRIAPTSAILLNCLVPPRRCMLSILRCLTLSKPRIPGGAELGDCPVRAAARRLNGPLDESARALALRAGDGIGCLYFGCDRNVRVGDGIGLGAALLAGSRADAGAAVAEVDSNRLRSPRLP
jgi:hypothetical protein